jgi:hypothetical protein
MAFGEFVAHRCLVSPPVVGEHARRYKEGDEKHPPSPSTKPDDQRTDEDGTDCTAGSECVLAIGNNASETTES